MPAKLAAITLGLLLAAPHAAAADPDKQVLAARARDVLKAHCYRCHGQEGSVEGAMNYVADLARAAPGISPTGSGLAGYAALTRASTLQLWTPANIQFLPREVNAGHAHVHDAGPGP